MKASDARKLAQKIREEQTRKDLLKISARIERAAKKGAYSVIVKEMISSELKELLNNMEYHVVYMDKGVTKIEW